MSNNETREAEIEAVAKALAPGIPGLAVTAGASELLAKRAIDALDAHRAEHGTVPPYMEPRGGYCFGCQTYTHGENHRHRGNPDLWDEYYRIKPESPREGS